MFLINIYIDALFHFVFPLIAILTARIRIKHKIGTCLTLATIAVFLDVDHFVGATRGSLHNIFVTLLLPIVLFILAFKFERKGDYYKNVSLVLLLFLFSHPILDMFTEGGVMLFYPFSTQYYDLSHLSLTITLPSGIQGYIISTAGIGLTTYFLMILSVMFVEDFLKIFKRERKLEKAFIKTVEEEEKKIEKEL